MKIIHYPLIVLIAVVSLHFNLSKVNAQTVRVAYVNEKSLYNQLPETAQINQTLTAYKSQLANAYKAQLNAFQQKLDTYSHGTGTLTGKEIEDHYAQLNKAESQNDQAYMSKENELRAPLVAKVNQAIATVAQEKNYNGVVDVSDVAYFNSSDDITSLVLQRLGVTATR